MSLIEIVIISFASLSFIGFAIYMLLRYFKNKKIEEEKYDFSTKYGTRVMLSPQTKDYTPEMFEEWTDSMVDFWYDKKGWSKEKSYKMMAKTEVEMFDVHTLEMVNGYRASGRMWPGSFLIEITTFNKDEDEASVRRVASLFRHETSHIVAGWVGRLEAGPNGGECHHKLFKEIGLNA